MKTIYFNTVLFLSSLFITFNTTAQCFVKDVEAFESSAILIDLDGKIFGWGNNYYGQLGFSNSGDVEFDNRVQIGTDTDWKEVHMNTGSTLMLKNNGTLWGCGVDVGANTSTSVVHQIGTDTWNSISINYWRVVGIKSNGTLWAWGADVTEPVQIGTDNDWKQAYVGGAFYIALKNNGTVWAWGQNGGGGCDTSSFLNNPTQIGTDTDWKEINASNHVTYGIKNNGTLWTRGSNSFGNLAQSSNISCSDSFLQVGTDNDWNSFNKSRLQNGGYAFKNNGTAWAWGLNSNGVLGIGTNTQNNYEPFQISPNLNWKKIKGAGIFTYAIKDDNSLWYVNGSSNYQYTLFQGQFRDMCAFLNTDTDTVFKEIKPQLYPNPVSTVVNIKLDNLNIEHIAVYDLLGKKVTEVNSNVTSINVADLEAGVYLLYLKTQEQLFVEKFIKQ